MAMAKAMAMTKAMAKAMTIAMAKVMECGNGQGHEHGNGHGQDFGRFAEFVPMTIRILSGAVLGIFFHALQGFYQILCRRRDFAR